MDGLSLGQCSLAVKLPHLCQDNNSNTYSKLQTPWSSFLVDIGSDLLNPIPEPWGWQVIPVLLIYDMDTLVDCFEAGS